MPSPKKTSSASACLFDSNVWIGLSFTAHGFHEVANAALGDCSPSIPAIFCRSTEQSFLRLASTPTLLRQYHNLGLTHSDIVKILLRLHSLKNVAHADEPPDTKALWLHLADRQTASPKLWMDAYLAAFAISGNFRFVTFDKDFRQFEPHGLDLHLLQS
jgi:uncharacterized protein